MRWFSDTDLRYLIKLVDDNTDLKAFNRWFVDNYKTQATTILYAYIYAVKNSKTGPIINQLRDFLVEARNKFPLNKDDVASEIWRNDKPNAVEYITFLVDNNIPFQVKDAETLKGLLTAPKIQNVTAYIENNPSVISPHITPEALEKIGDVLIKSNSYELVKLGLSVTLGQARQNTFNNKTGARSIRNTGRGSISFTDLLRKTAGIKNKEFRVKYIKEELFGTKKEFIGDLFGEFANIVKTSDMTGPDVVSIFKDLTPTNKGTYAATKLLHILHTRKDQQSVREIVKNWPTNLWVGVLDDIRYYWTSGSNHPELNPMWLVDYFDMIEKDDLVKLIRSVEKNVEVFVDEIIKAYPDAVNDIVETCPDKLPQTLKDIFVF